jgi:hypothetical protein
MKVIMVRNAVLILMLLLVSLYRQRPAVRGIPIGGWKLCGRISSRPAVLNNEPG